MTAELASGHARWLTKQIQEDDCMDAPRFVDIHCHIAPGIDDGAKSWAQSFQMAQMAVADGFEAMICTPHQLGSFAHNSGELIRTTVRELQNQLNRNNLPLRVLPGADVRIEPCMFEGLASGHIVSLADHKKHVLLELPHEIYLPLEGVLDNLGKMGMVGILSHPERNQGLLQDPSLLEPLVERGCLMQVTAGSLMGTFGPLSQQLAERMLEDGLVHFLATDAHGPKSRRPLMGRAYDRVVDLIDEETANSICCENPSLVLNGTEVADGVRPRKKRSMLARFLPWAA